MTFTQNSAVDSVTTKPIPDIAVPSFERSLEEFSHNCDALLYELVSNYCRYCLNVIIIFVLKALIGDFQLVCRSLKNSAYNLSQGQVRERRF